jgi:protein TonB
MLKRKDVDLNSEAWCDLVFEGRNQEYGAYNLRKTSSKRHLFAFSIVIAVTTVIFLLVPKIIQFNPKLQADEYELKSIELSDIIALEETNKSHQIKEEEKPQIKEIIEFTPPVITEDENVEEIQKELQETNPVAVDSMNASLESNGDSLLLQEIVKLDLTEEDSAATIDTKAKKAEFSDEKTALLRYIYQNIHYPSVAIKQRISGRVIYSFIINKDGSISDITLVQSVYSFLDDEVLRVIRSIPVWKPIMKDGKAIKAKYIVPVVFKL